MKVKFVSHASVIVTTEDTVIWSDPWLFGKTFNDSWSLFPEAVFDNKWLDEINYLWISHEHPDHFHIPTLKSLPDDFKSRVTILFQRNNSDKLTNALEKFGYKNIIRLPHGKTMQLTLKTEISCYQVGQMDATLAITSGGKTILNLNDAELNSNDRKQIINKIGQPDVVLNQFSMAGYNGYADFEKPLKNMAKSLLEKVYNEHILLKAKVTIPFASMMYFSTVDNKYINNFSNTPEDLQQYFKQHNIDNELVVLYPGEEYTVGETYNSESSLEKYADKIRGRDSLIYSTSPVIPYEKLLTSFQRLHNVITQRYYKFILNKLKPLKVFVPDLDQVFVFDLVGGNFTKYDGRDYDIEVLSQPLDFAMQFDWGFQTLGVSARHKVANNYSNYRWHRVVFSLNNAEVWLKLRLFLTAKNMRWIFSRLPGLLRQVKHRLASQVK